MYVAIYIARYYVKSNQSPYIPLSHEISMHSNQDKGICNYIAPYNHWSLINTPCMCNIKDSYNYVHSYTCMDDLLNKGNVVTNQAVCSCQLHQLNFEHNGCRSVKVLSIVPVQ